MRRRDDRPPLPSLLRYVRQQRDRFVIALEPQQTEGLLCTRLLHDVEYGVSLLQSILFKCLVESFPRHQFVALLQRTGLRRH